MDVIYIYGCFSAMEVYFYQYMEIAKELKI